MDTRSRQAILTLDQLHLTFHQGGRDIHVLRGASVDIGPGEAVALVGPSGAGKSSLLHIAGLLERPDKGRVVIQGRDCAKLNDDERTRIRRVDMGFVYQFHQLLPEFDALENIVLPQLISGRSQDASEKRAGELLEGLGLGERADHRPAELSGGEQQRVAIARALANSPKLLLADEPTGNLDPETADRVFSDLLALIHKSGVAALIATHNHDIAIRMDRTVRLADGQLLEQEKTEEV